MLDSRDPIILRMMNPNQPDPLPPSPNDLLAQPRLVRMIVHGIRIQGVNSDRPVEMPQQDRRLHLSKPRGSVDEIDAFACELVGGASVD